MLRLLLRAQMPQHTHTAWQNEYFVLTDNKNFPDVRMRVKDRWKGLADLGRSCGSKTLVPSHYGDDGAEPDQVILALKVFDGLHMAAKRWTFPSAQLPTARLAERGREPDVQLPARLALGDARPVA